MNIVDIPTWGVALTSLVLAISLLCIKEDKISIKIFSLTAFMQFIIYTIFTVVALSMEERQFIARTNNILTSLTMMILIYASSRNKNGH
jgi:hypothetical protein